MSYDWSVVGYSSHPIPGDPNAVQQSAQLFRTNGQHIQDAARSLQRLETGGNRSEALDKVLANADEVSGTLLLAVARYFASADALGGYAPVLARAKADAEAALGAAVNARSQQNHAATQANVLLHGAQASLDPVEQQELLAGFHQAKARAKEAEGSLDLARARIEQAIHDRDTAGDRAAQSIELAVSGKDINDSLGDKWGEVWDDLVKLGGDLYNTIPGLQALVDVVVAIGKWVWDNIETISLVLDIASLLFGWVPFLGASLIVMARVADLMAKVKTVMEVGTKFVEGCRTGDFTGFFVAAGTLLVTTIVSKRIGAAFKPVKAANSKMVGDQAIDRLNRGTWDNLAAERALARAKTAEPKKVLEFLRLAPAEEMRQTDALIKQLKMEGIEFRDLHQQERIIQTVEDVFSRRTESAIQETFEGAVEAPEQDVDSGTDQYRQCRQGAFGG